MYCTVIGQFTSQQSDYVVFSYTARYVYMQKKSEIMGMAYLSNQTTKNGAVYCAVFGQ